MRLEPRADSPVWLHAGAPLAAVAAALALAAVPLTLAGADLAGAYRQMAAASFGSWFALSETLTRATPLILTGLAVVVAFRARLWNIGAEGQLYLGAVAAVALGSGAVELPAPLLVPLLLAASATTGALFMLGPTLLKLKLGVDEVVTTLLLNFVALLLVGMLLEGPMQDPMSLGWPQSAPVLAEGTLPRLVARTRVHAGLIVALVAAVLVWLYLDRTVWGFETQAVGSSARAAAFAGMPVGAVLLRTGLISGALAGLAGAGEVAGLKGYLTQDLSPGFGYTGIVVAMLAQLQPLAVVLAAVFVAAVFVGADSMSRTAGVPSYIADLVVALSLLTMLLAGLVTRYQLRR
jgi:general nucleoside transport system permease protein